METNFTSEMCSGIAELFNLKETASNAYLTNGNVDIKLVRENIQGFLADMFNKRIRIKSGQRHLEITSKVLRFIEEIRFTATMENDKIGGLTPSSMTPGKQALFALSLLLDESTDTWPLLIDQPEDGLDSRSILRQYSHLFEG